MTFPPGLARLAGSPLPTGSGWFAKTMGISDVARLADGKPFESITVESTLEGDGLGLGIPQLSQTLEEPCPDVRGLGAGLR